MIPRDRKLRDTMQQQSSILQAALQIFENKPIYVHDQSVYVTVGQVVHFMKQQVKNFQDDSLLKKSLEKLIFLVGETGAGKSTLLNLIATGEENLKVKNQDGELITREMCVAEIGGEDSTTLIPNLFQNYLDCAGEGDNSGIIVEILNSIIKSKIALNTLQAKIIFVTPYDGLRSGGAYGMAFKLALDKNAQFIGNIQQLKNSIGFVITRTNRTKDELQNSFDALIHIEKHANMIKYKDIIHQIIENKYIQTFSKPQKNFQVNDTYTSPQHNPNQRQSIIDMIEKIPFTSIPHKDFFNTSSSAEVRETMRKAIQVVEAKAKDLIYESVKSSLPFNIYSVELKPFDKFIKGLLIGIRTRLIHYIEILNWNNYLKINIDLQKVNKVDQEINFLSQFANEDLQKRKSPINNWNIPELTKIFSDVGTEVMEILAIPSNNFSKFLKGKNLNTNSTSVNLGNEISQKIKMLYEQYKKLGEIKILESQKDSIYYKDTIKKQFSHKNKVPYTQKQKYVEQEEYTTTEHIKTPYEQYQTKQRQVTKYKKQKYNENEGKVKTVIDKIPYTQQYNANEGKTRTHHSPRKRNRFLGMVYSHYTVTRQVPLEPDWRTRQLFKEVSRVVAQQPRWKERDVPYQDVQSYQELVKKQKLVATQVKKTRPVEKTKDVTKFRQQDVYKDLTIRQFVPQKFNEDVKKCQNEIDKIRKGIQQHIGGYQKGQLGKFSKEEIVTKDKYEKQYADLLLKWQDAEYNGYFCVKPKSSLQELGMQSIEKNVQKQ